MPLIAALLVLSLAGCPERQRRTAPDTGRADRKTPDAAAAAPPARYSPCARSAGAIDLPAMTRQGRALVPRARKRRLVLGVLGDTREAIPETMKWLDRLRGRFEKEQVMAVVVLGGIDKTYEGIRDVLGQLKGQVPVLALPGDRESRSGFQAAVRDHGKKVVDLIARPLVVLPGATLIAVPGYFLPHHLMAREQGCSYSAGDLEALGTRLQKLPRPRVLLTHGPPRGSGAAAVDRAFGDVNIGDPRLRRMLHVGDIQVSLSAHVHESGGHATTVDGVFVPQGEWSPTLLLNVGSADSVPHEDLGGKWSVGTAAIVEIAGGKARYKMVLPNQGGAN